MIIDFKEIPQANTGSGLQDTFELFSRDFLEDLGFEIIQHPDRGADGKKDLIVGEIRNGVGGKTIIRWLVSCKHYIHSGKSISDTDEPDIIDRVNAHKCKGFIGVYSTIPATSLNSKLQGYASQIESIIYDRERIEKQLLSHGLGIKLAKRYFPISTEKYIKENPTPARIFSENPELKCDFCGKDLLITKNGIFVVLKSQLVDDEDGLPQYSNEQDVYISCKGDCDMRLEARFRKQNLWSSGWEDISDLMVPTLFIKNLMAFINDLNGCKMENKAIEKMKKIYLSTFPHIARELTEKENEIVRLQIMFEI
jgi:hypothetical protein